ncbi:MAG: hypothetical protein ACREN5_15330, partial [Gemmatimonadales bacterium]
AFDETALLIDSAFVADGLDLNVDVAPNARLSVSAGGGATWLSDGNRRIGGVVAVMGAARPALQVGVLGRTMGYREPNPGRGYFAPDRFTVLEARTVYAWRRAWWGLRVDGGLGWQQVGSGAPGQTEWHAGLSVTRTWRPAGELAFAASVTNSAASRSASGGGTPGFRYWTIGIRARHGF